MNQMKALFVATRLMHKWKKNKVVKQTSCSPMHHHRHMIFQSAQAAAQDFYRSVSLQLLSLTFKDAYCFVTSISPTHNETLKFHHREKCAHSFFSRYTRQCSTIWNRKNGNWKIFCARALLENRSGTWLCFSATTFLSSVADFQTCRNVFHVQNSLKSLTFRRINFETQSLYRKL